MQALAAGGIGAGLAYWYYSRHVRSRKSEVQRVKALLKDGTLVHPTEGAVANFTDLAHALALCCGFEPEQCVRKAHAQALADEIGCKRHLIFVLCDGMGNSILARHLQNDSFLRTHNDASRLAAVFPSTTPAALTTLATGAWPGQHGAPGWDLRDQKGCEFPGEAGNGPVQLRVLHARVTDMRTHEPAGDRGFTEADVFVAQPWAKPHEASRRMLFVNAYNNTEFPMWYRNEGAHQVDPPCAADISETVSETIGKPEGAKVAVEQFEKACGLTLRHVKAAEGAGRPSYTYIYTAHPDKHMHALGVEHSEVRKVVHGLDNALKTLHADLAAEGVESALLVTADHGHISVKPEAMLELTPAQLECLEYANIGVHGKGRHATLHVRAGRKAEFQALWRNDRRLVNTFALLTVEEASELGLFGPTEPLPKVRPRLGDFIAISLGAETLVTPNEKKANCHRCQGAHGSLFHEEMRIPYVRAFT